MDLEAVKKLFKDPKFQKYLDGMDEAAQAAEDEYNSNIGEMSEYPSKFTTEYTADYNALDTAWDKFNKERWQLAEGKATSPDPFIKTYTEFVLKLGILEEQNIRYGAYVAAGVAKLAAILIAFLVVFNKNVNKRFKELEAELKKLETDLEKAKKLVKEAEAQRLIGLAITALSLLIPAVGIVARIGVAAGTFTVQMAVDAALGPDDPSLLGGSNNAAGALVGVPKSIKPKFAKMGGAISGLISFKLDSGEVADAKKIVEAVKKEMESVKKLMKSLEPFLDKDGAKLEKLLKDFTVAVAAARAQESKYKSAESARLELLKELEAVK